MVIKIVSIFCVMALGACASLGLFKHEPVEPKADAVSESGQPADPEKKKKEEEVYTRCAISNGAGRVFYATDSSRYIAESKARRQCGLYSRSCVLLNCTETTEEGE